MTKPINAYDLRITESAVAVADAVPHDGRPHIIKEVAEAAGVSRDVAKSWLDKFADAGLLDQIRAIHPMGYRWRTKFNKEQQALLDRIAEARKIYRGNKGK